MYAATMDILVLQIFNSLFYASVLFLIAAGLSLIFGVMRIVNMAHGTFYAVGAFVTAWLVGRAVALGFPAGWMFLLMPVGAGVVALLGAVIEPLLLRPFYRRAEEYQLLVTFGLLLILEDVIRLLWGGLPLSAEPVMDALPIVRIAGLIYPAYNLFVIGIGVVAALLLWVVIYRTKFGVMLRATHGLGARDQCRAGLHVGICDRLLHGGPRRRDHRAESGGGARDGLRRAHTRLRCRRHRRPRQPARRARRRADRELRAHCGNSVLLRGRARRALSDRGRGAAGEADRAVRRRGMKADVRRAAYRPKGSASNRPPPAEWTHRVACHGRRATSPICSILSFRHTQVRLSRPSRSCGGTAPAADGAGR